MPFILKRLPKIDTFDLVCQNDIADPDTTMRSDELECANTKSNSEINRTRLSRPSEGSIKSINVYKSRLIYNSGLENEVSYEKYAWSDPPCNDTKRAPLYGYGKITWKNSDSQKCDQIYEGIFNREGKIIKGLIRLTDGTEEQGRFNENEELEGEGVRTYSDGRQHKGHFVNGLLRKGEKLIPYFSIYEKGSFDRNGDLFTGKRVCKEAGAVRNYKQGKEDGESRRMNFWERIFNRF